jgi:Rad3-related DNA helicase
VATVKLNDLVVGRTYRHARNRGFVVTVMSRFESSRGESLILKHDLIEELQVCLVRSYELSKWGDITCKS